MGDGGRAERDVRSHEARGWHEHVLGDAKVAVGSYNGFRLIIDPAKSSVTLNDATNTVIGGEGIDGLKFPSAAKTGIKIKLSGGPVDVEEGETSTLVVKFDVTKSFVMRGNSIDQNGLLFKPVIRRDEGIGIVGKSGSGNPGSGPNGATRCLIRRETRERQTSGSLRCGRRPVWQGAERSSLTDMADGIGDGSLAK